LKENVISTWDKITIETDSSQCLPFKNLAAHFNQVGTQMQRLVYRTETKY